MLVQFIFFGILFPYCLTTTNNTYGFCQKINLCREKTEPCYPVVMKCQKDSCHYRHFSLNHNQRLTFARWFYDSNLKHCRQSINQTKKFVYFRFQRDCKRVCLVNQQNQTEEFNFLLVKDSITNYNNTVYVKLDIDLAEDWIENLSDLMNISTDIYHSQVHYFQNYRRRFTNFRDSYNQLMPTG
ncbi:unnamed protein product [Adineta steineri]|uniref:Uncharacterized protein n=2 Tax=Adineta steineri TaxID=433720 RepID=A0A813NJY0_9BILA|nr:unnamed protein product [Adineta steineri]